MIYEAGSTKSDRFHRDVLSKVPFADSKAMDAFLIRAAKIGLSEEAAKKALPKAPDV